MGSRGPVGKAVDAAPTRGRLVKEIPDPPEGLGSAGRAEWERAAAELGPEGRNALTECAVGILEDLARYADDAEAFRAVWQAEGATVVGQGRAFAHPMIAAEREARTSVQRLRRSLGITPDTAVRVPSGPAKEPAGEDPMDEFA